MNPFKSTLIRNIFYLGLIQGSSFLIPLLLLPFLIKALGTESYGRMIFYQVIVTYMSVVIDFGFNFSSTQDIARNQDNKNFVSKVFNCTILSKFCLFIVISLVSLVYFVSFASERNDYLLFIFFIPQLFGVTLTPAWLFQGLEKTKVLALCTIFSRIITSVLIFLVVKDKSDIYIAAFLQSSTFTLTAIISLFYCFNKKTISVQKVNINDVILNYRYSFPFFISVFSVNLYTTLPAIVIGVVLGNVSVAYYNVALTIRNALQGLFNPVSQSLFPRINNLYTENPKKAYKLIKQSLFFTMLIFTLIALCVSLFSDLVVNNVLGHHEYIVISLVQVICFLPIISAVNNILGVQTLILHGYKKMFSSLTIVFGVLNCFIIYPMLINFGVRGAVYSSFIIELLVLLTFGSIVINKKLLKDS